MYFFLGANLNAQTKNPKDAILTIDVLNKFQDYKILIYWFPRIPESPCEFEFDGPAIISFENSSGQTYFIYNSNFAMPTANLPVRFDEQLNKVIVEQSTPYKVSFPTTVFKTFPNYDDKSFFFLLDVDFDGRAELFSRGCGCGQRGVDTFMPIFGGDEISTNKYEICGELDGLSEINPINKTITIAHSNGANDSYSEVYRIYKNEYGGLDFKLIQTIR